MMKNQKAVSHEPSFTMCAFPAYCSERKSPKPRVELSKLHSVRLSPKRTNSGIWGLDVGLWSVPGLLKVCRNMVMSLFGNKGAQFIACVLVLEMFNLLRQPSVSNRLWLGECANA
jgi:hypothetical protein